MARTGVLLTAFGGPDCLDSVAPFMCSIMGTEPSEQMLTEAQRKYLTIGGFSPLPAMAERIAAQLERVLNGISLAEVTDDDGGTLGLWGGAMASLRTTESVRIPVAVGMLHSEPSIEGAVARLVDAGARQIVVASLSPFEAAATTGAYLEAVTTALDAHPGVRLMESASYHRSDDFIGLYADNLNEALHEADILANKGIIIFTAHSLPVSDIEADPSYVDQLRESAAAVAAGAGLGDPSGFHALPGIEAFGGPGVTAPWLLAYQSKGRRGGEWLGPDLDDVIDAAIAGGFAVVIVCPVGFAVDHMETLYDLDVKAADRVLSAEKEFVRVAVPNADPKYIEALADAVRKVL
jgi:ferrochelatase